MRQSHRRRPTPNRRPQRTPRRTTRRRSHTNTPLISQRQAGGLLLLITLLSAASFVWFRNRATFTPSPPLDEPAAVLIATVTPKPTQQATRTMPATEVNIETTDDLFQIATLPEQMVALINQDRDEQNLPPLAWHEMAATVAEAHSAEMNQFDYLNHRNLEGLGPDHRYSMAGGTARVQENVYTLAHSLNIAPHTEADWLGLLQDAQQSLMDSPGHRAAILSPTATHVGIGLTYAAEQGKLHLVQLFVHQHIALQPTTRRVQVGEHVTLAGQLLTEGNNVLINLAYEPYLTPLTQTVLRDGGNYTSSAEIVSAIPLDIDDTGAFRQAIQIPSEGPPGLYHIRIWIEQAGDPYMVSNIVVEARE